MKTYKQFTTEEPLNEISAMGIAIERKLKSAANKIHATDNVSEKLDLLADALHFALGSLALELQKSKRR